MSDFSESLVDTVEDAAKNRISFLTFPFAKPLEWSSTISVDDLPFCGDGDEEHLYFDPEMYGFIDVALLGYAWDTPYLKDEKISRYRATIYHAKRGVFSTQYSKATRKWKKRWAAPWEAYNGDDEISKGVSKGRQLLASLCFARDYSWTVDVGSGLNPIRVYTDAEGVKAFLKDRAPDGSRRKALVHWVNGHHRHLPDKTVAVREHFRGAEICDWRGLKACVRPSGYLTRRFLNQ